MTNTYSKEGRRAITSWIPWGRRLLSGGFSFNRLHPAKPLPELSGRPVAGFVALVLGLLAGCATHEAATNTPQPGSGVEEYRQLTSQSAVAVLGALSWLEQVSAQANRCPPKLVAGFTDQVEQLQIESIRVRARAQAIQARGDAYFEAWAETGNLTIEAQPRPPANLPQVRESFDKIKLASQHTREAFRPFFAGLRKLRGKLETDPGAIETDEGRELIRTTREHGLQVLQELARLGDELQVLRPILASSKPASSR